MQLPPSLHETIAGVAADRTGTLWIATSAHVVQVNRNRLLEGTLASGDVHVYGLADGLHGSEGVKRCRSVIADGLGRIWFSLNRGISVVDPGHMPSFPSVLPHLEAVLADGVSVDLSGPVRISSAQRRITFNYGALSLSNSEPVKYRYMLAGFDEGWSEPVTTREAIYTNLRPGSYRFRLLAGNGDDLQNRAEVTLPIAIEPQFWQTWWFLLVCVLSFLLLALVAFRIRIHQVNKRFSIRLEERVEERTRIARELHDTLLQSFQGLMLRLQVVDELLPEGNAKEQLEQTLKRADQAIAEGRSAVYDLRSSAMATNDLAQAVRALGNELATPDAAAFHLVVEGSLRDMDPIVRDELYRITREALRNAFRHARAQNIEVEISYAERLFRLSIRDDGEGIAPEILRQDRPGHYGLAGMRERARQIGAKLSIWSGARAGTEIELTIPGSKAYGRSPTYRGWPLFRVKVG
jgi:signal transduction histidine kinase